MAESIDSRLADEGFRWPAFFQRSHEPIFLLSRQRRVLFVNRAWEQLTGIPAEQARGLVCKRRKSVAAAPLEALANTLSPPVEALEGQISRIRRLGTGADASRRWWHIEFIPLLGDQGLLGILGKVTVVADVPVPPAVPLPEKLVALRERVAQRYRFDELASELPALQRVADQARLAAQTQASVLIVGESGTGKHWLARTIHSQGVNRERTFVGLDCTGLPPAAVADALFGAAGLARRTSIGTLYFLEPSALPRELQAQLAEWLSEPEMNRPRVIAGLTREPANEVKAGRLQEDLFCALGTLQIALPPLRQRLAELPLLAQRFLERINVASQRRVNGLTSEAWNVARGYRWPGNLREFLEVLAAGNERSKKDSIDAADLPAYLRQAVEIEQLPGRSSPRPLPLDQLLQKVERRLIVLALGMARGNKSRAAELLEIWRARLIRRMKELEIPEDTSAQRP